MAEDTRNTKSSMFATLPREIPPPPCVSAHEIHSNWRAIESLADDILGVEEESMEVFSVEGMSVPHFEKDIESAINQGMKKWKDNKSLCEVSNVPKLLSEVVNDNSEACKENAKTMMQIINSIPSFNQEIVKHININLQTYKLAKQLGEVVYFDEHISYDSVINGSNWKYYNNGVNNTTTGAQQQTSDNNSRPIEVLNPTEDCIIRIEIRHQRSVSKWIEVDVVSSQCLTVLRDLPQLICSNEQIFKTTSDPTSIRSKSSCFFIDGVFYDDMRHSEAQKYSDVIIAWLAQKKEFDNVVPAKSALMEATTFSDIKFRIGAHYLYLHDGDCEHHIVFKDIRIPHKDIDEMKLNIYPRIVSYNAPEIEKCLICRLQQVKWVTIDDPFSDVNPCSYCDHCFTHMHRTPSGELINTNLNYIRYMS